RTYCLPRNGPHCSPFDCTPRHNRRMRGALISAGCAMAAAFLAAGCGPSREAVVAEQAASVQRYCLDCHNDAERAAEPTLQGSSLAAVAEDAALWERVLRKVEGGMMPPADAPRPSPESRLALVNWLESELDAAAAAAPDPGRTEPFHRLNRNEYRNAVRDLLALDVDVGELLPADDASYGFDNIAGVLKLSPTLLERYLNAADKVSRLAVGTASPFVAIDWFRVPDDRSQERRLAGLPFGTRGGTAIDYTFPQDGDYEIAAELQRDLNEQVPLYAEEQTLEIAIDGERVAVFTLPAVPVAPAPAPSGDGAGPQEPAISQIAVRLRLPPAERAARNRADESWRVRVPVKAGTHRVTATVLARTAALDESPRLPFLRPYPAGVNIPEGRTGAYLRAVEISGPYDATGVSETPSRARLFTCHPPVGAAVHPRQPQPPSVAELACATEILSKLARHAYRRPVTAGDVEPLLDFFREGLRGGHFDAG